MKIMYPGIIYEMVKSFPRSARNPIERDLIAHQQGRKIGFDN